MPLESHESPDFASLHHALKGLIADIEGIQKDTDGFPLSPDQKISQQALIDRAKSHDALFASDFQGWSPEMAYDSRSNILTDLQTQWHRLRQQIHAPKAKFDTFLDNEPVISDPDPVIHSHGSGMEMIDALAKGILNSVRSSMSSKPNWENW